MKTCKICHRNKKLVKPYGMKTKVNAICRDCVDDRKKPAETIMYL